MRNIFISIFILATSLFADELQKAYQKEYAYLIAERDALQKRLTTVESTNKQSISSLKNEIKTLQDKTISSLNKIDLLNKKIVEASRTSDSVSNDDTILEATLLQARESLSKLGFEESTSNDQVTKINTAFKNATAQLFLDEKTTLSADKVYLTDGVAVDAEIINVGRVFKYAITDKQSGLLAPVGNGQFKIWEENASIHAKVAKGEASASNVDIFIYESVEKEAQKKEEKTIEDNIEASGIVGYVIIGIGIFGILLAFLRVIILLINSSNNEKIKREISTVMESGDVTKALQILKTKKGASAKVTTATLKNIKKDRNHLEDIISESILHESSTIDRFGSAILIIAAVAPLLGLLGTVTGMISTFDIITEHGTGDPKLLSSGISEALLTTEFGLIVAIPMLLLGNLLSRWAENIKNDMEKAALHIINIYKKD